ncbi:MAG: TonB family protein [Candidatus Neomarinimicrobiota bacterium]
MSDFIPLLNHLASGWLANIYTISIQTVLLFLFAFLISRIFRKAPAIFLYYLWGIVFLRFVFFGTIRIPEALLGLFQLPQTPQVFQFASIAIEPVMTMAIPRLSLSGILFLVWIGGIFVLSLKLLISEKRFYRSLGKCNEIDLDEKLKPLLVIAGIRQKVKIIIGESVPAPFVKGFFRPVIYLPASITIWPEERLRNTLMHEIAHIKRRDILAIALQNILSVLYFFNPVVWLTALQLNSLREKACDDFALIKLNEDTDNYGKSLLFSLEDGLRQRRYPVMANGLFFPRNIIIKRFDYLYQKGRKIMVTLKPFQKTVLIVVGIVALFLACMAGDTQIPKPKFVKYDSPPEPIGGFKTIQENLIYPEKAKQSGIEGKAVIQAQVGKDGVVKQSVVLQSSGNAELDAAALEAINKTKFKPAYRKEKPVSVYISIPVIFKLKEKSGAQSKSNDKQNIIGDEQKTEFVPYDEPPSPIGGFKAIQENLIYPEKAKQAGIEGTTVIQAKVDENGDIEKTVILQSSENAELDAAAIEALKKTKFKPAVFDKKPVGVYISIPVMFNLGAKNEEQDKSEDSDKTDDNAKPDSLPFDTSPEPVGGFAALQRNIVYPAIAQEGGVEGMVIVQASIDEKGNVTKCTIARGIPNTGLDEAAINAVKKTHFKPATLKGKPVEVTISIPINFKNAR